MPLCATLYVAGVPIPDSDAPTSVPEPASFALIAAPLLLLMICFTKKAARLARISQKTLAKRRPIWHKQLWMQLFRAQRGAALAYHRVYPIGI
jgi:hypothetical protein